VTSATTLGVEFSVGEVDLRAAAARLAAAGIEEPLREARILARAAAADTQFESFIVRRERREPVAYILGRKEFWSLEFEVSPAVLIPRPDSETLIETALAAFKANPPARVLDLGTGSGCLLIALLAAWPRATGMGVDISEAALTLARRNALRHHVAERAEFRLGDWGEGLAERFDLILANPPYIADDAFDRLAPDVRDHEPVRALRAGRQGLDAYRRITGQLPRLLAPQGRAIVEIGFDQAASVKDLFTTAGLEVLKVVKDLGGDDRALVARLPQSPGA
jgi:release factor glutamine methyltransferase